MIWPFASGGTAVVGRALREVEQAARRFAHARRIVCVGYTDALGTRSSNFATGLERARNVCARLRRLGVHATLKLVSRGEREPRASNATAQGRALNRRVELRIGD